MSDSAPFSAREASTDEFLELAGRSDHPLPIEQGPAWDAFDAAVEGREHLGRVVVSDGSGQAVAVVSLTRYRVRGFPYLWARHAPVMLTEATPEAESAVREAIAAYVRAQWPDTVFMRIHATHAAPELRPLLQTVTYDKTVFLDLTVDAETYLAGLSKKFRYTVRQSLKHDDVVVADETDLSRADFDELYAVYLETAGRDGFGIYDAEVYWAMIEALRPHARVFVARRTHSPAVAGVEGVEGAGASQETDAPKGHAIAWAIITLFDGGATYYYAAASAEARELDASVRLLWDALEALRASGATQFDMGGVDSKLAPTLVGVGMFKRKWGPDGAIAPAWDVPLRPLVYRALVVLLKTKRLLRR